MAASQSESHTASRWPFFALCFYLLSQAYMVPLVAVGPSWAIWPTLSDLALGALVVTFIRFRASMIDPPEPSKNIFRILMYVLAGTAASFCLTNVIYSASDASQDTIALFQFYRLAQFFVLFWVVIHIPLTDERLDVLRRVVTIALVIVCVSVALSYLQIVPTGVYGPLLPHDLSRAGPWASYLASGVGGQGTIDYNHGYTGLQIMMLFALRVQLGSKERVMWDNVFLIAALLAVFVSEARADFLGMLVFAAVYWARRPAVGLLILTAVAALAFTLSLLVSTTSASPQLSQTVSRQLTLTDPTDAGNLSGRDVIWEDRIAYLDAAPVRWVTGAGFGSANESSLSGLRKYAHMLYLQVIVETGLIGFTVFAFLLATILRYLHRYETGMKPIFWITIGLLFTSFSEETFYPVPAFEHFIGFYLCAVAIALRTSGSAARQPSLIRSDRVRRVMV